MYLVIRLAESQLRENTLECFCMNDPVELSKLRPDRFKIYKLDGLQEVKEFVVTTEERLA